MVVVEGVNGLKGVLTYTEADDILVWPVGGWLLPSSDLHWFIAPTRPPGSPPPLHRSASLSALPPGHS